MHYDFPVISHLDDVLPAIVNSPEFIVAEREHYIVINYMVSTPDTFPAINGSLEHMMRRECRGLMFHLDGTIMARRLHKFFNLNECDETLSHNIDVSKPHKILEKLDGSMVTPIRMPNDTIRWATKMGITDTSMLAEVFVVNHDWYNDFALSMISDGFTPIFEFCSNKARIVVDYPVERLVLIAVRNTRSGQYMSYQEMLSLGEKWNIEVVKQYPGTVETMNHLAESVKDDTDSEGYIVRFDDGHMVKIKNEWYIRLHKTKDMIRFERNLVGIIVNNELDDLKSFLSNEDLDKVLAYEKQFHADLYATAKYVGDIRVKYKDHDKKAFALDTSKNFPDLYMPILFKVWDGLEDIEKGDFSTIMTHLLRMVTSCLTSNVKFEKIRPMIPNCTW